MWMSNMLIAYTAIDIDSIVQPNYVDRYSIDDIGSTEIGINPQGVNGITLT